MLGQRSITTGIKPDGMHLMPLGLPPHVYPHLLILLPSPCTRGEGLRVRGFALCFDLDFDREFNV
jgi:hypothetical protein